MLTIDKTKVDEIIDGLLENNDLTASPEVWYGLHQIKTIQPVATDINVGDKISKFIDGLEEIFADLRERHVDDSVCGLCEYDGAYMGQSGDWCNECPGFEKDDCFKLSDKTRKKWTEEIIKALPTVQPEPQWIPVSERLPEESEYYIITANDGVGHRTTFAKFQKKAKSWDLTGARSYWRVIAWMPLPEAYKQNNK